MGIKDERAENGKFLNHFTVHHHSCAGFRNQIMKKVARLFKKISAQLAHLLKLKGAVLKKLENNIICREYMRQIEWIKKNSTSDTIKIELKTIKTSNLNVM